jgi:hypothetical protein
MTVPEIPHTRWRKSSYSGGGNGQCVECVDLRPARAAVALRDSKNTPGPTLLVGPTAFAAFLASVSEQG